MPSASIAILTTEDAAGDVFIVKYQVEDEPVSVFFFFDREKAWDYAQKIMDIAISGS